MVWTPIVLSSGDLVRQKHQTPNYDGDCTAGTGREPDGG